LPDIFLSYSREDQATARRFAEGFERAGFSVWWDQALNPGEAFDKVTEKALDEAKAVVVLWSKHSVGSRWVRSEATQANSSDKLVPVMIEPCKRPIMFELTHSVDLSGWNGDSNDKAWQAYVAGVRRFVEKDAPGVAAAPTSVVQGRRISVRAMAIAAVAVLAAAAGLWVLNRKGAHQGVPTVTATSTVPAVATEVTLAVLPFADMSPAKDQEYFSDGLSEEILNQLAQIDDLRVTGRTSSFSFKGKNEDLRVIGEKLGVGNLLEGSIRKDGSKLRITAQLINSKSGAHLWSQTYDRELKDVFAVQEEIAKDVAKALSVKLDVGETSRARGGTTNLVAYDKFLQARALLSQDAQGDRSAKAVQLGREAVALDPAFVRAWAVLADALRESAVWMPENTEALRQEIDEVGAHIESLAPDGTIAKYARWQRLMQDHKWSDAEATAKASSGDLEGARIQIVFLLSVGRYNEAIPYAESELQRDPQSLTKSTDLQLFLHTAGRRAEAQAEYERSKDMAGDHSRSEFIAIWRDMGNSELDRATLKARVRESLKQEDLPLVIDASLADKLDNNEAARAVIHKAFNEPANQEALRMFLLSMYAGNFGDRDLTLATLRRASVDLRGGVVGNIWLPLEPGLRADPRFKDLLRDLGLVNYYRASGKWPDFCKPVGTDDFECH
jgi:TolB-like protein